MGHGGVVNGMLRLALKIAAWLDVVGPGLPRLKRDRTSSSEVRHWTPVSGGFWLAQAFASALTRSSLLGNSCNKIAN